MEDMNEMEDIKSYEQFIEFARDFLITKKNSSVIVDEEMGRDILDYFKDSKTFVINDEYVADEDGIYLISRVAEQIIVESPFSIETGELLIIESDNMIVFKSLLTNEEIDMLKENSNLIVISDMEDEECDCVDDCCSDCCDEEMVDEFIEEIMEDLSYELENSDTCPNCLIKSYLYKMYNAGKVDGVNNLAYDVKGLMENIING